MVTPDGRPGFVVSPAPEEPTDGRGTRGVDWERSAGCPRPGAHNCALPPVSLAGGCLSSSFLFYPSDHEKDKRSVLKSQFAKFPPSPGILANWGGSADRTSSGSCTYGDRPLCQKGTFSKWQFSAEWRWTVPGAMGACV